MLISDKYLSLYLTFQVTDSTFSHFPSSGQLPNEGVSEHRELAHALLRPEHICIGLFQQYFITQSIFPILNPHKQSHFLSFYILAIFLQMESTILSFCSIYMQRTCKCFEAFVRWQNVFSTAITKEEQHLQTHNCTEQKYIYQHFTQMETEYFAVLVFLCFSGLSLVLNKEGL